MTRTEMMQEIWDYESNLMTVSELQRWAERGFKDYLYTLSDLRLKNRHEALEWLRDLPTEETTP